MRQFVNRLAETLRANLVFSKGSLPLAIYTFLGLTFVDVSMVRAIASLAGSSVLLFWCSKPTKTDENEADSWRWSAATSRGIATAIILTASAILPMITQRIYGAPWGLKDGTTLVASLSFAFIVGVAVYLMLLLRPTVTLKGGRGRLEALKLEHQACLTLFQTMCTGAAVLFIGMFLAPVLGMSERLGEVTLPKLAWAFYWMLGAIVWLLRPCLARAKYIRTELEELAADEAD